MYVAVFIAAYFFTPSVSYEILGNEQNKWLVITGLLLRPSQGTLNAIFFVYHKIYDLRKCNDDLRICEALYISIVEPFKVPEIIIDFGGLETGEVESFKDQGGFTSSRRRASLPKSRTLETAMTTIPPQIAWSQVDVQISQKIAVGFHVWRIRLQYLASPM